MKERPIIFTANSVRAILAGRKTMTRRLVKPAAVEALEFTGGHADPDEPTTTDDIAIKWQKCHDDDGIKRKVYPSQWCVESAEYPEEGIIPIGMAYGQPGDRLWVRETWYCDHYLVQRGGGFKEVPQARELLYYRATDCDAAGYCYTGFAGETMNPPWNSSRNMPRWAARITLEVTGVRVERLQDISEADAAAEGITERAYKSTDGIWLFYAEAKLSGGYAALWESIHGPGSWDANPWVWVIAFKRVAL